MNTLSYSQLTQEGVGHALPQRLQVVPPLQQKDEPPAAQVVGQRLDARPQRVEGGRAELQACGWDGDAGAGARVGGQDLPVRVKAASPVAKVECGSGPPACSKERGVQGS